MDSLKFRELVFEKFNQFMKKNQKPTFVSFYENKSFSFEETTTF